jgi:hypothetical protein
MQTPSFDDSRESSVIEAPTASSITPAVSGNEGEPESESKDQPTETSDGELTSQESDHTPQPGSEAGGDQSALPSGLLQNQW